MARLLLAILEKRWAALVSADHSNVISTAYRQFIDLLNAFSGHDTNRSYPPLSHREHSFFTKTLYSYLLLQGISNLALGIHDSQFDFCLRIKSLKALNLHKNLYFIFCGPIFA